MNNSSIYYRREQCRLCNGKDLKLALPLTPTPLADSYIPASQLKTKQTIYPLDLYLCGTCGFSQLLDVVQPQAVYVDYIYETKSSLGLADHFNKYADEILGQIKLRPESLVIDIGSNDGTLLKSFKNKNMRVLGIDPAREIARKATENGIETLPIFFTEKSSQDVREKYGPASLVTTNNLFANVDELQDYVKGVKNILADDGLFIFESFYLVDLMKNMVFDFIYHEHLSAFSVKPLQKFFLQQGMELVDVHPVSTKGGSLRYFVQKKGGPRKPASAVSKYVKLETDVGSDTLRPFKDFSLRINSAKDQLVKVIDDLRSQGKKVAGYGASATTTTLLYHFGLTEKLDCIFDDYPSKQNLFCPSSHIPVLPSEAIYEHNPHAILIIAWRYFDPIVKKHQAYLKNGGQFIIPLPTLKIIGEKN